MGNHRNCIGRFRSSERDAKVVVTHENGRVEIGERKARMVTLRGMMALYTGS